MRILVATDLSADGEVAVDVARTYRARYGGTLAIAHIVPPATRPEMLFPGDNQDSTLRGIELQRRVGDHLRATLPEDAADAELIVEEGNPAERLLELAAERSIDLLVLGGRDPGGKRVFGSVAEAVLTHATIPVLIAREHPDSGEVIAATDLRDDGLAAITKAVELSQKTLARITVLHVAPSDEPAPDVSGIAKRVELPPTATISVEHGDPADAIVAAGERHNAQLIVLASRGRRGLARFIIGSVASAVVRRAACSVLVVPLPR